jgi:hypothetical protein
MDTESSSVFWTHTGMQVRKNSTQNGEKSHGDGAQWDFSFWRHYFLSSRMRQHIAREMFTL